MRFTSTPIDGRVQLIEERLGDIHLIITDDDRFAEPYPVPEHCVDIEKPVASAALRAWAEANPSQFGGLLTTRTGGLGARGVRTIRVVGDLKTAQQQSECRYDRFSTPADPW